MPRPLACRSLCLVAALVAIAANASAQERGGPVWCGKQLGAIEEKGVLVWDGKKTKHFSMPGVSAVEFNPSCTRVAVVGDHIGVITLASGKLDDMGAPPSPATSVRLYDGARPAIAWTPSGARFAVAYFGGKIRWQDVVFSVEVPGGPARKLSAPVGEVSALGWLDEKTALAGVDPAWSANKSALYRLNSKTNTRVAEFGQIAIAGGAVVALDGSDIVAVDPMTGAKRRLAGGAATLLGTDGRTALASLSAPQGVGSQFASVPLAGGPFWSSTLGHWGTVDYWSFAPGGKRIAGPGNATNANNNTHPNADVWADDGRRAGSVYDAGPVGNELHGTGRKIEHVRIAPDGKRAAVIVQIGEGRGPKRCDWSWKSRRELVVIDLDKKAAPKKVATLRHDEHCAVE